MLHLHPCCFPFPFPFYLGASLHHAISLARKAALPEYTNRTQMPSKQERSTKQCRGISFVSGISAVFPKSLISANNRSFTYHPMELTYSMGRAKATKYSSLNIFSVRTWNPFPRQCSERNRSRHSISSIEVSHNTPPSQWLNTPSKTLLSLFKKKKKQFYLFRDYALKKNLWSRNFSTKPPKWKQNVSGLL